MALFGYIRTLLQNIMLNSSYSPGRVLVILILLISSSHVKGQNIEAPYRDEIKDLAANPQIMRAMEFI